MKKFILAVLIFVSACPSAFASPDRVKKADAGIHFGGFFQQDGDISDGFFAGGSIAYGVNKNVAIGMSAGWSGSDLEVQQSGNTIDGGNVSIVPLFGEIIFRAPNRSAFVPYAVIGLGTVLPYVEGGSLSNVNLKATQRTGFAAKFGLGTDWFLSNNWIFNVDTGYVLTDSNMDIITLDTATKADSKDLDYWYLTAGVKYLYD